MTDSLADLLKRQREHSEQQAGTPVAETVATPVEPEPRKNGLADLVARASKPEPVVQPGVPDDAEEMARVAKEQAAKAAAVAAVVAGKAAKQAAEKTKVGLSKLKQRWATKRAQVEAKREAEAVKRPQATVPEPKSEETQPAEPKPTLIVDGKSFPTSPEVVLTPPPAPPSPYMPAPAEPLPPQKVSFVDLVEAAKRKQVATPKDHRSLRNGLILLGGLAVVAGLAWGGVELWHEFHKTAQQVVVVKPTAKSIIGKAPTTVPTRPKVAVLVPPSSAVAVSAPPLPHTAQVVVPKPQVKPPVLPTSAPVAVAKPVSQPTVAQQPAQPAPAVKRVAPRRHAIRHHISTARQHIDAQAKKNMDALKNFFKQVNSPSNGGQP